MCGTQNLALCGATCNTTPGIRHAQRRATLDDPKTIIIIIIVVNDRGPPRTRYRVDRAGVIDVYKTHTHTHTHTRARTHAHAHTHARDMSEYGSERSTLVTMSIHTTSTAAAAVAAAGDRRRCGQHGRGAERNKKKYASARAPRAHTRTRARLAFQYASDVRR